MGDNTNMFAYMLVNLTKKNKKNNIFLICNTQEKDNILCLHLISHKEFNESIFVQ